MKDEVIGGLKNALERGSSIESAIRSMISAGYNEEEVQTAAASISKNSVSEMLAPKKAEIKNEKDLKKIQQTKPSSTGKKILIIGLIILLLLIIGSVVSILLFF